MNKFYAVPETADWVRIVKGDHSGQTAKVISAYRVGPESEEVVVLAELHSPERPAVALLPTEYELIPQGKKNKPA